MMGEQMRTHVVVVLGELADGRPNAITKYVEAAIEEFEQSDDFKVVRVPTDEYAAAYTETEEKIKQEILDGGHDADEDWTDADHDRFYARIKHWFATKYGVDLEVVTQVISRASTQKMAPDWGPLQELVPADHAFKVDSPR